MPNLTKKHYLTTHGKSKTPEYHAWVNMKDRCLNPKHKQYKDYGGRGIQICERWLKLENFFKDMGERPSGLTLDRINNDGNYEPSNCKWATWKEQQNNRRPRLSRELMLISGLSEEERQIEIEKCLKKIDKLIDLLYIDKINQHNKLEV